MQAKFGERMAAINAGIEKEGAFYLFALRLVPLFPFFVINLLIFFIITAVFTKEFGLAVGDRVQQGEVIGYVGMTGLASGPHVHYEYRVNGVHKNPARVTIAKADPIPASLMADFQAKTAPLLARTPPSRWRNRSPSPPRSPRSIARLSVARPTKPARS
mgnify:CR=1 FL=1